MYLTDKRNRVFRELHDHEELEVLLESFSKQVEEIVNEAGNIEVIDIRLMSRYKYLKLLARAMCNQPRRSSNLS